MSTFKKYFNSIIIAAFVIIVSCSTPTGKNQPTDTPTSGEVNIAVDESFTKLFDTQIYTFESLYKNAKVHVQYQPENIALQRMIDDSCKVAVMCRDLTPDERKNFEANNLFPISTKIAEDAIAIIVNPENPDSVLTVDQIKSILTGNDSIWNILNKNSKLGKINAVFDNESSANARYMKDSLLKGNNLGKNVFAVKSNPEVIDYVSKNKNAIGFLSVNWISDIDDSTSQNFLKQVKLVAIKKDNNSDSFKPYQGYIQTKEYPFTRSVYMINRQTRAGLGKGFVSFVAGEKGQLIIKKAGLIPSIAPIRLMQINPD